MGIILLFFLWLDAVLFVAVLWRLQRLYPSFMALVSHWATWAGLAAAMVAQLVYLGRLAYEKKVYAFDLFFVSTWQFGIYPLVVALVLSFLPRSWAWAHLTAHALASFALSSALLCFVHLFFMEQLYAYFKIRVYH